MLRTLFKDKVADSSCSIALVGGGGVLPQTREGAHRNFWRQISDLQSAEASEKKASGTSSSRICNVEWI